MATEEDVQKVITQFQQNFPTEGFIAFDSTAAINFIGSILVNYKGLRVIRLKKSQLMMG